MSSKSTKNLELHAWERTDAFRMDEFNDNFDKLDKAVGENTAARVLFTCGTYTGDGKTSQFIGLPFTPEMVYVGDAAGRTFYNYNSFPYIYGGVALKGRNNNSLVEVVEGGFQVSSISSGSSVVITSANSNNKEYLYFAIG